jgi:release factor glutamine methyltransferase
LPTFGELRRLAARRLAEAGLPTPDLDARLLVENSLALAPGALVLADQRIVEAADLAKTESALARRLAGEPVDRILGSREFWGLEFRLSPATLSPRPDTEMLVDAALRCFPDRSRTLRILDLGTGSGAILVALLHEFPLAFGVGLDRAEAAVRTARDNAHANGVGVRAAFLVGDWDAAIGGPFDLVVSNPPYIKTGALAGLDREVRDHDPHLALDGGADGLEAYRAVIAAVRRRLNPGGVAVVELGLGQDGPVAALAASAGLIVDGPALADLGGVPRALVMRVPQ